MAKHSIRHWLTNFGVLAAHPAAFLVLILYTLLWIAFERHTLDWHGAATLATWLMTLFIVRAAHRDTQALQGKLDELLRVNSEARNELTKLDEKEPEEIEEEREEAQKRQ